MVWDLRNACAPEKARESAGFLSFIHAFSRGFSLNMKKASCHCRGANRTPIYYFRAARITGHFTGIHKLRKLLERWVFDQYTPMSFNDRSATLALGQTFIKPLFDVVCSFPLRTTGPSKLNGVPAILTSSPQPSFLVLLASAPFNALMQRPHLYRLLPKPLGLRSLMIQHLFTRILSPLT